MQQEVPNMEPNGPHMRSSSAKICQPTCLPKTGPSFFSKILTSLGNQLSLSRTAWEGSAHRRRAGPAGSTHSADFACLAGRAQDLGTASTTSDLCRSPQKPPTKICVQDLSSKSSIGQPDFSTRSARSRLTRHERYSTGTSATFCDYNISTQSQDVGITAQHRDQDISTRSTGSTSFGKRPPSKIFAQ